MVSASPSFRTRMWTRRVVCARNTAACPAELPPPTTTTSSPRQSCASIAVAPKYTPTPSKRAMSATASFRYATPVAMMTLRGEGGAVVGLDHVGLAAAAQAAGRRGHDHLRSEL